MSDAAPPTLRLRVVALVALALLTAAGLVFGALPVESGRARPVRLTDRTGRVRVAESWLLLQVHDGPRLLNQLDAPPWVAAPAPRHFSDNDAQRAGADAWTAVERLLGRTPTGTPYITVDALRGPTRGLRVGDHIVAVNHHPATWSRFVTEAQFAGPRPAQLLVLRAGELSHVTIPASSRRDRTPDVSGSEHYQPTAMPWTPVVLPREHGASGGLVNALAMLDQLRAGRLSAGRRLAVTGELSPDGRVWPIGGVPYKVAAAVAAHAELVVVPLGNLAEARRAAHGRIPVVGVRTLRGAVLALSERQ